MTTFTESIFNNTEETLTPGTKSPTPVPSAASITAEPEGQSTAPSSRTSTQDISASSQNHQSQRPDTTSEAQTSTLTQMMTSTLSSSSSVLNGTETVSQKTSPPDEMSTSFLSSVTNTFMMTSKTIAMTTSTDSTLGNIEETSTPGTESSTPVTSAVSITAELEGQSQTTSSRTSIQDTSASSQNHQTQSTETTKESQTSTLTQRTTSIPSFSPSVHNVKGTISQKTSPPGETTTSSLSSVTNTPMMTSKKITMTTSTDSTLGNTGKTSVPVTRSLMPVTSAASITAEPEGQLPATSSRTSTQDTTVFSQNHQSQSTEITSEAQTDTLTQMMTSTFSSSPSVLNVTDAVSWETSPTDEMTTSFPSSVTNTLIMTAKTITMTTSTDSTLGNTEETSTPGTKSSTPVTSAVSVAAELEGQSQTTSSRTSMQDTSDSLQNHQTQSIETTRVSQINTLTPVTTSTVLSSPSGFNPSGTVSQETFPSGETTTSSPSSVSNAFLVTSEVFRMPTSRDSTLGNTEEISLPVRGTISAITSRVSTIWLSDTLSTALSLKSLPPKISTAFHTQQSEGAETTGRPHERSSVSPGVSHETFTPHETTTWPSSFSSEDRTTQSPKELPSTPTGAATRLVTGSPFTGTAGTIPRVPSEVSTIGESGQPTTHPSHSTTLPETTGAGAQTQWTQETGTTGEVLINSPSYSVTQMINTATSPSSSPMLDGHTSQQITMAPSTNHSTIHSTNTSPQESLAVSQRGHTQAPQTTQESQTTRSISPVTDTKTVTTPGSSFTANGHSPSEIAPQDAPTRSAATTFAPAPTGDGHTTQAPTTALQAAPSSPDSTLRPSGGASLSITGALPGVVSTPGGPEGRWTSASASTSPDTAAAMTQTHQAESTEASGETQTSEPASSGSGTTSEGTTTPSSSRVSSTTLSGSEGISTSGETTWFSPNPSRDSHTTQSTTELLSASASHDATPVSMGMVSAIVPSTFPVTLSEASTAGRPTGQSSPTSPSASPQETAAISRMVQTQRTGTSRGSDTISLVSQATDTFSTVTPTPPSITSSGLTSPQTETHTLSPSGSSTTFIMAFVSNTAPGPAVTSNSTTLLTGHATPPAVTSASSASTVSSGSPLKMETSGMTTPSVKTDGGSGRTATSATAPSAPPTTSQAATSTTPSTATHSRSTAAPVPVPPEKVSALSGREGRTEDRDTASESLLRAGFVHGTGPGAGDREMTLVPFSKGQMDCLVEAVRGLMPGSKCAQWKAVRKAEPGVESTRGREECGNRWNKSVEGQGTFNATGVRLSRNGSVVSASFDGWAAVSVVALSDILHASASLPPEYQNRTEGLLGVWNNSPEDDFRMPNGSIIPPGSSEETLFHYGMTWQINGTGLLGKRNDQLPSNFTPVFYSQLQKNSSWDEDLISNCHGDSSCIYDTLALRNASIGFHTWAISKTYKQVNTTLNQYPPSINGGRVVEAYKGQTTLIQYTSNAEDAIFTLRDNCTDFKLFENGTLLWTPKLLEPFTLEILARSAKIGLASAFQPRTVVCHCNAESQCLYNQTSRVGNSSLEVAGCKCDGGTFGRYCERSKDACEEPCFPSVRCIPGKGCEACPPHLTGDGRHCAAPGSSFLCRNQSCPVNYCYNQGHCYISQTLGCQPTCTCPPAFTDSLCFLAGNNFSPTVHLEPPLRVIQLLLSEEENASMAEVNASVAYILGTLDMRAFLRNSQVNRINSPAPASGNPIQHWMVTSEFQYRPWGPVIDFLNNQLLAAVVEAFLHQVPRRSEESRNHVVFQPISREDVWDVTALNVSTLKAYFKCNGYKGYDLVYSPQSGFTCVSPCSRGYCDHGGQCQHLPSGPRCSCVSFSIYTAWGERCERLSMKLNAFFGIFFGSLGGLLLLGVGMFVVLRFWDCSRTRFSYFLHSAEASP
ncbi:mucin-4 [Piliocolobus tephrosceles]|uniref:mucin-4 n=1 Tax=Piliocolobus tephrosceles TaxID=591936 RepID=UPI000E6AE97F|nr:mucin-4 [Piliocolobus tephrosceles]